MHRPLQLSIAFVPASPRNLILGTPQRMPYSVVLIRKLTTRGVAHPRLIRNPVHFPRLPSILRERLFKVSRIRRYLRPEESHIDRSALPKFLIVKLTAGVCELAHHRQNGLPQRRILAVRPIDAPLMSLRIISAQSEAFDMSRRTIGFELLKIGPAIPDLPRDR